MSTVVVIVSSATRQQQWWGVTPMMYTDDEHTRGRTDGEVLAARSPRGCARRSLFRPATPRPDNVVVPFRRNKEGERECVSAVVRASAAVLADDFRDECLDKEWAEARNTIFTFR
ncbi:hypothetical protein C0Q70_15342 [Pomacea canaliculata]|uniref:Uncharacterized protein n=1 Tax=Pomacea canaliculata TaxID=400727 RepID=A0A2T7NUM5_POMCA|nr:hypothetical protein C0Q70_15342 [Pomacea canaliculata]